jgi:glycosyltransferase involved in cell wall biosynthesis
VGRPLIIHIINSLIIGGAEVLLRNSITLLDEYEHLVVYLNDPDTLKEEFDSNVSFICLDHKGWTDIFSTTRKLKRIIEERQPLLVHSHLFVSTVCARLATPKNIPLVTTLHSTYSVDAFMKNSKSTWAEKLTLKKRHSLIAVSNYVLTDYLNYIPFSGKKFVLYNFLPEEAFSLRPLNAAARTTRCVAVGNLKEAKNYPYLLDIFSRVKDAGITLDIYGEGSMEKELQKKVRDEDLPVRLVGKTSNTTAAIRQYDLFIQASAHEGFGLSVIEAMAAGIPVMMSDIPVFREISGGYAHFFPLGDAAKAADQLLRLKDDQAERTKYVNEAFHYCRQHYTASVYKRHLLSIYEKVTGEQLVSEKMPDRSLKN